MPWNRPINRIKIPDKTLHRSLLKFSAIGAMAIALIFLAYFLYDSDVEMPPRCDKQRHAESAQVKSRYEKIDTKRKEKSYKLNSVKSTHPPSIENPEIFLNRKKGVSFTFKRPDGMIFTNEFENFLCDILTATPGERFLETDLDDSFDESFNVSLLHEISISPDDSEDIAMIKTAVKDSKMYIREEVLKGRRPRDVVLEARAELNKIADYHDQLTLNLRQLASVETDPEIVKKYAEEANKQLSEFGALPVEAPLERTALLEYMEAQHLFKEEELNENLKDAHHD